MLKIRRPIETLAVSVLVFLIGEACSRRRWKSMLSRFHVNEYLH